LAPSSRTAVRWGSGSIAVSDHIVSKSGSLTRDRYGVEESESDTSPWGSEPSFYGDVSVRRTSPGSSQRPDLDDLGAIVQVEGMGGLTPQEVNAGSRGLTGQPHKPSIEPHRVREKLSRGHRLRLERLTERRAAYGSDRQGNDEQSTEGKPNGSSMRVGWHECRGGQGRGQNRKYCE
jgi:hypothetical protein